MPIQYFSPWVIPAVNKYMGMLGFALMGNQAVQFRLNRNQNPIEAPGLYYKAFEDSRHVIVCTNGAAWNMQGECMTLFKIISASPQAQLPQDKPYSVYYYRYKLCGLYWKESRAVRYWNGEIPFLDKYVAPGSLQWTIGIHENTFSL